MALGINNEDVRCETLVKAVLASHVHLWPNTCLPRHKKNVPNVEFNHVLPIYGCVQQTLGKSRRRTQIRRRIVGFYT